MAQYTTIDCPGLEWTQLTDADVTSIRFQVQAPLPAQISTEVYIKCTTDATPPTSTAGADIYRNTFGEADVSLAELGKGLSGAVRVWAYPVTHHMMRIKVGHA